MMIMTIALRPPDPQRDGRFGWLVLDTVVIHDPDGHDVACTLISAAGHPGDPAEQAMPSLADTLGLDSRPGAHTDQPELVSVTLTEGCATLHLGDDLQLPRAVPPEWWHTADTRRWVRLVIGYRAKAAKADLDVALSGHGVTAIVPVRV